MTTLMIFSSIIALGFGCSFGCGTVTTPFILGSLLAEGQDIKKSRQAMLLFSIGKVLSLSFMGLLASLFGSAVLSYVESIYPESTIWIVRTLTITFALWLLYSVLRKDKCASCKTCAGSANTSINIPTYSSLYEEAKEDEPRNLASKVNKGFYFGTGALYSTIPCAPLLTALGYASTMSPPLAMLLLALFGIVNSLVPVFGFASIVGLANKEFKRDAPQYLKYIKISGSVILILSAIYKV